jgi:hypothetical protein
LKRCWRTSKIFPFTAGVAAWPQTTKHGHLIRESFNGPVLPQETRECDIRYQVNGILQQPGKQLRIVFAVVDQFGQERRLKAVSLLVVDERLVKTKVFRVRYFAGDPPNRTPQTPAETVTVYLPDHPKARLESNGHGKVFRRASGRF